jgi:hypothetical protein
MSDPVSALLDDLARKAHRERPSTTAFCPTLACLLKSDGAVWIDGTLPEEDEGRSRVLRRVAALRLAHLIQFGRKPEAPAGFSKAKASPELLCALRDEVASATRDLGGRINQENIDALVDQLSRMPVEPVELLLVHKDVVPRTYWALALEDAFLGRARPLPNPGGYWGFASFDMTQGAAGEPQPSDPWKKSLLAWSAITDLAHAAGSADAAANKPAPGAPAPDELPASGITDDEKKLSDDELEKLLVKAPEYVKIKAALAGSDAALKAEASAAEGHIKSILTKAKTRSTAPYNRRYYLSWLLVLLRTEAAGTTGVSSAGAVEIGYDKQFDADTRQQIVDELRRFFSQDIVDPWGTDVDSYSPTGGTKNPWPNQDEEENLSNDPKRKWTMRLGGDKKSYYYVDRSDLRMIVVHIKIRLRPVPIAEVKGAPANWDAITSWYIKRLREGEDAIEKHCSGNGYYVNVEFVDPKAPKASDIFPVDVKPGFWTNSGNFVGPPSAIAHETHHLLNLDDRYNRLESHATNDTMSTKDRLYWFLVEMDKDHTARDKLSIMHSNAPLVMAEDICAVAFEKTKRDACLKVRLQMEVDRGAKFPPLPPGVYVHP